MKHDIIDVKLKNLIQVCKETQNFKKLAVVSFVLTGNAVDKIGINLGLRPRNRSLGEKVFEYMKLINTFLFTNLNITLFQEQWIAMVKDCEILFLKTKGRLPHDYIKMMFTLYYDLRKLEAPNVYKTMKADNFLGSSELGLYSYLAPTSKKKKDQNNLTPLILQKLREKERILQKELNYRFNSEKLETMIHLHSVKQSLSLDKKRKITIQGTLKDNLNYQHNIENIVGYFILGIIVLLIALGIVIIYEISVLPSYAGNLSVFAFIFFGSSIPLIWAYMRYIKK
ncbi:MAG: hypothetical protein ACFFB8_03510 [Promethearchaeota archaeon]